MRTVGAWSEMKLNRRFEMARPLCTVLLALGLAMSIGSSAEAQGADASGKASDTPTGVKSQKSVSGSSSSSLPQLSQTLTDLHDTIKHLKHAATNLIGEMNRTEMKILEYDDYINQYVDDKPVQYNEQLYPYGFQNIGNTSTVETPMQPRKKWVQYYVQQMGTLLGIAQNEVQSVLSNPAAAGVPSDLSDRMKANVTALQGHVANVTKLASVSDNYDKAAIQTESEAIRDEGGDIDMCSRKLYRSAKEKK